MMVKSGKDEEKKIDIEGIKKDGEGGLWIENEGNKEKIVKKEIIKVDEKGVIRKEVDLKEEIMKKKKSFGMEGIKRIGEGEDDVIWMDVKREWEDEDKGKVKMIEYRKKDERWKEVEYKMEEKEKGWVGIQEIKENDGNIYIIERDNMIGNEEVKKRIYKVEIDGMKNVEIGEKMKVVKKKMVKDLIKEMKKMKGLVKEKMEGLEIKRKGNEYEVKDNEGVDGRRGEKKLF